MTSIVSVGLFDFFTLFPINRDFIVKENNTQLLFLNRFSIFAFWWFSAMYIAMQYPWNKIEIIQIQICVKNNHLLIWIAILPNKKNCGVMLFHALNKVYIIEVQSKRFLNRFLSTTIENSYHKTDAFSFNVHLIDRTIADLKSNWKNYYSDSWLERVFACHQNVFFYFFLLSIFFNCQTN